MSHFVAYILQFQEIIVYKIFPGGKGSIASLMSIYFSFRWQKILECNILEGDHSVIPNIIDIKEIGKGHTSESHQRIVLFSHT